MKKLLLLFLMSTIHFWSFAQKVEKFMYGTKYILTGDTLKMGKGSLGGKTYVNVFIDQSKLTANTRLTSQFDGYVVIIKEFKYEKKEGKKVLTTSLAGLEPFKTKCYLKEALETGELVLISRK